MLLPLLTGIALVMLTVIIHALGTLGLIRHLGRRFTDDQGRILAHKALSAVIWMMVGLLVFHTLEIVLWALSYRFFLPGDVLTTWEKAVYFSFVTYTTLGYGDISLHVPWWRLLSGIEALSGVLLLGWSTALLFALVQKSWHDLIRRRIWHEHKDS